MPFRIVISDRAFSDMEEAADFIWADSPANARRWLSDCWQTIEALKDMPHRHAVIPEAESLRLPYRSVPLHSHRLIYRVDDERTVINVVRVYHSARRPLAIDDV